MASKLARRLSVLLYFAGVGIYFFVNFQRTAVPGTIFNEMQLDLNVSATTLAGTGAMFLYTYAILQFVTGLLADKYGGLRLQIISGFLLCIGCLLFPFVHTTFGLYASRLLVGLGGGLAYISAFKETDRLFPNNFTVMVSVLLTIGYSGGIFAGLPLAKLVEWTGSWRKAMLIPGVLLTINFFIFLLLEMHEQKPPVANVPLNLKPIKEVATSFFFLNYEATHNLPYAIYMVLLTVIGKKMIEDMTGCTSGQAALGTTCMVIISSGFNYFSALITKALNNRRVIVYQGAEVCGILGCVIILIGTIIHLHYLWFVFAFIGIAMFPGNSPVMTSMVRENVPSRLVATTISVDNGFAFFTMALFSNLCGWMMEFFGGDKIVHVGNALHYPKSSYFAIAVMFVILYGLSFWRTFYIPETYGKNIVEGKNAGKKSRDAA